jgi:ectoine hydroxylase-related dioxygenase (phytanoyl-CoA dioxygenase family)
MTRSATNAADAKRIYAEDGIVVIENVLDAAALDRVRRAVRAAVESDNAGSIKQHGFAFDPDDRNIRIFNLCGKDRVFRELVEHPLAIDLVTAALGPGFILSNFSGNITGPGSGAMGMHADAGYMPEPWGRQSIATNIAWAVDDFTVDVGATRYVPGSTHFEANPRPGDTDASTGVGRNTVVIECPAGSIFAMDGKVWHQTGPNTTADKTRTGLFAYYVRPFIRAQYDWTKAIDPADMTDASPLLRHMLGFTDAAPMSGVPLPYPDKPMRAKATR